MEGTAQDILFLHPSSSRELKRDHQESLPVSTKTKQKDAEAPSNYQKLTKISFHLAVIHGMTSHRCFPLPRTLSALLLLVLQTPLRHHVSPGNLACFPQGRDEPLRYVLHSIPNCPT